MFIELEEKYFIRVFPFVMPRLHYNTQHWHYFGSSGVVRISLN